MAFLSKEIRFLRWPFPALCLRQSSSLRLSSARHIPSSHLNWRKVLHKTGFAALPAPDFQWRCFPVQVWELFKFLSKEIVEMGKAEMEKIKWNWNRVSAIIDEIKHRVELHRILPLKAVLRQLSYLCKMFQSHRSVITRFSSKLE